MATNKEKFRLRTFDTECCFGVTMDLRRRLITGAMASLLVAACAPSSPQFLQSGGIVALDWALAETLLALGYTPAGVVAAADWARFVVAPPLPEQVADLGLQQELNFELIATLRPDVILISPFLQRLEPQLKRIAKTSNMSVYEVGDAPLSNRIQVMNDLALLIGAEGLAETWITEFESELAFSTQRLTTLKKRPVVIGSFIDHRHLRVYGGNSLYAEVFSCLQLQNGWRQPVGYFGFATIGIEQLANIGDIEFIAVEPIPVDIAHALSESPLWRQLPFVKQRRWGTLPPIFMYGGIPSASRMMHLLVPYLESRWA